MAAGQHAFTTEQLHLMYAAAGEAAQRCRELAREARAEGRIDEAARHGEMCARYESLGAVARDMMRAQAGGQS